MAYPYTIAPFDDLGRSIWFPTPMGPYLSSAGNRYVIGIVQNESATARVRVAKSADAGQTWAIQDTVGSPFTANHLGRNVTAVQRDDVLYVAHLDVSDFATILSFDMATDTWGPNIASSGPKIGGINDRTPGTPINDGGAIINMERHADGSFILTYITSRAIGLGPYYTSYVECSASGTWGTPVGLSSGDPGEPAYFPNGIILGDAGVRHFFLNGITTGVATNGIYHCSLNASNALSAIQTVTTDVVPEQEPFIGYPATRTVGGATELNIGYVRGAGTASTHSAVATAMSAETPIWEITNVSSGENSANINDFLNVSIAVRGTTRYALWIGYGGFGADFIPRLWYSVNTGSAWRAERLLYTGNDGNNFLETPVAMALTNTIGIVFTRFTNAEGDVHSTMYFEFTPVTGPTNYCFAT